MNHLRRPPIGLVAVAATLVAVLAAGAVVLVRSGGGPAAGGAGSGATAAVAPLPAGAVKPMLTGLIDRARPAPERLLGPVHSFVVNVYWADLQPQPTGPLAASNQIDAAIATARNLESTHPDLAGRVGIKVRLFAGVHAPEWVKHLGGDPIQVTDPTTGASGTVGRFWSDAFGRAYDDLQARLAARYDSVPEIREVTVSRCSTLFAETLIRDERDPATVQRLLAAGFTFAADQTCLHEQIDAHRVWEHTRTGFAVNPYQDITGSVGAQRGEQIAEDLMAYCRQALGRRCVLENNSIRWPTLAGVYPQLYAAMQRMGQPLSFQTATSRKVGDLLQTISWATGLGANAVELPAGYATVTSAAELAHLQSALEANNSA